MENTIFDNIEQFYGITFGNYSYFYDIKPTKINQKQLYNIFDQKDEHFIPPTQEEIIEFMTNGNLNVASTDDFYISYKNKDDQIISGYERINKNKPNILYIQINETNLF
jgi:hypothetical protein